MKRLSGAQRADWRQTAQQAGFVHHSAGGVPYWDESAHYGFTLPQIEDDIEAATASLHSLCLELVDRVVRDPALMARLAIPSHAHAAIHESWMRGDGTLYGRFDLAYDGERPPKLLEFNADTPTSLYEASVFQWIWLEQGMERGLLPPGSDQFNSLHDRLVAALRQMGQGGRLHLTCLPDSEEDRATVLYLEDCARQAGLTTHFVPLAQVGLSSDGRFVDERDQPIDCLFKLYPWEWMFADDFGRNVAGSPTRFLEPPWKAVLSNKGLLPLLWELAPDHPNLLEAWFEDDPRKSALGASFVKKPLLSREGANVLIVRDGTVLAQTGGPYAGPAIRQALAPMPEFDGQHPVIGSWIVAGEPAGLGIREDSGLVTGNNSRFVPHVILPA